MLFNSLIFIYLFLPITLFFVFITAEKYKNLFLLLASWVFYAWSGISFIIVLLASISMNYLIGLAISRPRDEKQRKFWFITGIGLNLLLLIIFKYTNFLLENLNFFTLLFGWNPIIINHIFLPLGISFFTFKAISYLISLKRRETPVQKNFTELALYLSIFPEIIAGPIDRYRDLSVQIHNRTFSAEQFASGVKRFTLGLFKKVLISTPLATVADKAFDGRLFELTTPMAWLGLICFALQIYYDFSGYTDMAIGLGRMLGFTFVENFNFPYLSKSVREFWKRWHISLSTFLRDYLFLPVAYSTSRKLRKERYGGIRVDHIIYIYATLITFLLCGFWHGAAWNFILWGLIHGAFLSLERTRFGKWLDHSWSIIRHSYFLAFILFSWVFFRNPSVQDAFNYLGVLSGNSKVQVDWYRLLEFWNIKLIGTFILALIGTTNIFNYLYIQILGGINNKLGLVRYISLYTIQIGTIVFILFTIALSTLYLISGTSNAFIYFRF